MLVQSVFQETGHFLTILLQKERKSQKTERNSYEFLDDPLILCNGSTAAIHVTSLFYNY